MTYIPDSSRYLSMHYRRCGRSGLLLPAISLGLWHNFGAVDNFGNVQAMLRRAFRHPDVSEPAFMRDIVPLLSRQVRDDREELYSDVTGFCLAKSQSRRLRHDGNPRRPLR